MDHSKLFLAPPPERPILSHCPGISLWLPNAEALLRTFPVRLQIESDPLKGSVSRLADFELPVLGPVDGWTVRRWLQKPVVEIEGRDRAGSFFRYEIQDRAEGIWFVPKKGFKADFYPNGICLAAHKAAGPICTASFSRLDLGGYKAPVWEERAGSLQKADDMRECLQWLISLIPPRCASAAALSDDTMLGRLVSLAQDRTIQSHAGEELFFLLKGIVKASFSGVYAMRPSDDFFLGYPLPAIPAGISTNEVLQTLSFAIHAMIARVDSHDRIVLGLPRQIRSLFPSGRAWNLNFDEAGVCLSYEWRKGVPRRLAVRSLRDSAIEIEPFLRVKEYAVRSGSHRAKKRVVTAPGALSLQPGIEYGFDNFIFL